MVRCGCYYDRTAKEQLILGPKETAMYTWDDPGGTRSLWWSVVGNMEKCIKPISLNRVMNMHTAYRSYSIFNKQNSDGSFKLPPGFRAITNVTQIPDASWSIVEGETDDSFTEIVPEASSNLLEML